MCCLLFVSIKKAQSISQKTITWIKKSGKGWQECHKACELGGVPPRKLKALKKTCFASRIVLFQESFEFKHVIILCYGTQQLLALQSRVASKFGHSPSCC